jgi:predicted site-specific integrase-resolvase
MTEDNRNRGLQRDAFSMKETAEKLGISYMSVFRLVKRGLLKPCVALRIKLISQKEIDRFLKEGQAI